MRSNSDVAPQAGGGNHSSGGEKPLAKKTKHSLPLWQETILLLVVALCLAIFVKAFFVESFYVPSGSMEPTLQGNPNGVQDRILIQKVSYWTGGPSHGDVVVFRDPDHWLSGEESGGPTNIMQRGLSWVGLYPSGGHLVKRVIGVGGDHVRCCDAQGRLQVNGTSLDEPFVKQPDATKDTPFSVTVPRGNIWVMGDNRGNSQDSRAHMNEKTHGFVPVGDVTGKVALVVWPWKDRDVLHDPPIFTKLK